MTVHFAVRNNSAEDSDKCLNKNYLEHSSALQSYALQNGKYLRTFRNIVVPSSLASWTAWRWRQRHYVSFETSVTTYRYGATSQDFSNLQHHGCENGESHTKYTKNMKAGRKTILRDVKFRNQWTYSDYGYVTGIRRWSKKPLAATDVTILLLWTSSIV